MTLPAASPLGAHGARIPAIGFGTSGLGDCGETVATALRLGYRHIDTARKYGTERGVGEGLRASGVARSEVFLTTKVSHEHLSAAGLARSLDASLAALGVDHVDLLLVHWPNPQIPLAQTMSALARAKRQGSTSPFSTRLSGSAPSRWSTCRRSIIPISTRPGCSQPVAAAG
jgi:diketogulonate reductase-like aldo/keto reductase